MEADFSKNPYGIKLLRDISQSIGRFFLPFGRVLLLFFIIQVGAGSFFTSKAVAQSTSLISTNKYSAGVEFYGLTPYPNPSTGARLGYLVGESSEMELTYVQSKKDVLLAEYQFLEANLRFKSFLNSFVHWGLGLGFRDVKLEYDVFLAENQGERHLEEHHQAITGNFHFGVEFTLLEAVTLGSDLFSLSVPLNWSKHNDGFPDDVAEAEEDPKEYPYVASGFTQHMQFLRTYMKVRF